MKQKKAILGIVLLLVTPILINYALLSWRAPGVNGDSGDWLGFLANFVGLIGAVLIALYQFTKQKEHDEARDIESNRSYVDIQDFNATMMMKGVITHENSRVMKTVGYSELLKKFSPTEYGKRRVSYFKISQFGNLELIMDCKITVNMRFDLEGHETNEVLTLNIGVIEKGIEIFIPIVPKGIEAAGKVVDVDIVEFNYSTLKGERLSLYRDYLNKKETLYSLKDDSEKKVIYEFNMKEIGWIYPNKIDHSKL